MKLSEVTNKAYIGKPGAPSTSYVLVNYAEGNAKPTTYKVSVHELGQAIAADLHLYAHNTTFDQAEYYVTVDNDYTAEQLYSSKRELNCQDENRQPITYYNCYTNVDGRLAYMAGSSPEQIQWPVAFYMRDPESSDIILVNARGEGLTQIPFMLPNMPSSAE